MSQDNLYQLFLPQLYLRSVFELPVDYLHRRGIRGLIFDLDNTLLSWNALEVTPEAKKFFNRLREAKFSCCLVSNNKKDRVKAVADVIGLPAIYKARKPGRRAFRQALSTLGTAKNETAVIGDQIFTDVLGGNRLGLYTVLVMPLSKKEFVGTRVMRFFERIVLRRLIEKGLIEKPVLEGR